jgi:hypothetical protein
MGTARAGRTCRLPSFTARAGDKQKIDSPRSTAEARSRLAEHDPSVRGQLCGPIRGTVAAYDQPGW